MYFNEIISFSGNKRNYFPPLIIWEKLKEVFKFKLEALIKEASAFRPFLVCPAKYFEEEIKHLFIDEGQKLDSIEDLEFTL